MVFTTAQMIVLCIVFYVAHVAMIYCIAYDRGWKRGLREGKAISKPRRKGNPALSGTA